MEGGDGPWAGSSTLSGWIVSLFFSSLFTPKSSSSSISSLPPKCSQSEGAPAASTLNLDLSSRGGGGIGSLDAGGFGEDVLFSARCA